jgi:hypothetical protein
MSFVLFWFLKSEHKVVSPSNFKLFMPVVSLFSLKRHIKANKQSLELEWERERERQRTKEKLLSKYRET